MRRDAIDLFCGVGWDLAARGIDPLGIDFEPNVCATREVCGMRTLHADVSALDPLDFAPCWLLIGSPPCTAFSMAGKGKGRDVLPVYASAVWEMAAGRDVSVKVKSACDDDTAHLVLEPLRWALALEPSLVALEQVPPVLPLWDVIAEALRERGYWTWSGVLEAERYGVPQTRERAILMASSSGPVQPPAPTHQRHVPGELARHEITLEGELLPWVSMAEALGWGMVERPGLAISHAGQDGGSGARASIERERESMDRSRTATGRASERRFG